MKRTQVRYETASKSLKYVCSRSATKNKETEYIFEEIIVDNYPNLMTAIKSQLQKIQ